MNIFDAIKSGDVDAVRSELRDHPSAAADRDDKGVSAVRAALYAQRQDLADAVLEATPELDVFDAAAVGDVDRLTALAEDDPNLVGAWSGDGFAPLHLAAFFGRGDAVRLLLDRGAEVGAVARNDMEVQALHSAVAGGHRDIVAALLVGGADPNARQQGGITPLMAAEENGDAELVRLLMDHGAEESATA
ncbi:MAG: ankyrin repeat domain-containing protein, partial [Actinomycetota bacterium]|nr:ankyrin repeat domain-containing protein [Actinomycetota bacterium]